MTAADRWQLGHNDVTLASTDAASAGARTARAAADVGSLAASTTPGNKRKHAVAAAAAAAAAAGASDDEDDEDDKDVADNEDFIPM